MHKVATKYEDPQMTDFLEGDFLKEQVQKNLENFTIMISHYAD